VIVLMLRAADSAKSTSCATFNPLGNTLELVVTLPAAGEDSALSLEFIYGQCG